jgi:hypothetical protein
VDSKKAIPAWLHDIDQTSGNVDPQLPNAMNRVPVKRLLYANNGQGNQSKTKMKCL